jgi:hypothetical protein
MLKMEYSVNTTVQKNARFFLYRSIEAELQGLFYDRQQINEETWKFIDSCNVTYSEARFQIIVTN